MSEETRSATCKACGAAMREGARYCWNCGAGRATAFPRSERRRSNLVPIFTVLASVILGAAAIAMALWGWCGGEPSGPAWIWGGAWLGLLALGLCVWACSRLD
ncbi:MAG: hypothetical protein HYU66_25920 [Armatimonadetes bacterium]|nr:hypothetical protein [Armatimonadota bacterium]